MFPQHSPRLGVRNYTVSLWHRNPPHKERALKQACLRVCESEWSTAMRDRHVSSLFTLFYWQYKGINLLNWTPLKSEEEAEKGVFICIFNQICFNQPFHTISSLSLYIYISEGFGSWFLIIKGEWFHSLSLLLFFAHIIWWWYKYLVRIANMEDDSSRMFLRALVIMGMLCFSFIP